MRKPKPRYIREEFGGFNWLGSSDPTPVQIELIHFLARWRFGTHHFGGNVNECGRGVTLTCSHYDLSTYDADRLTWLVLLAHKYHVRVELGAAAPGYMRVHCHQRKLDGDRVFDRHPDLTELIERASKMLDVEYQNKLERAESALKKLRDCDWVISLPDRMDAVREIAREGLGEKRETTEEISAVQKEVQK